MKTNSSDNGWKIREEKGEVIRRDWTWMNGKISKALIFCLTETISF